MDINVTHVPYRGEALAIQDLVAGRIDYQCVTATTAKPQFESKTVNDSLGSTVRSPLTATAIVVDVEASTPVAAV